MTTYLIHREMSPLRHADKQTNIFLPDFSESVKTKKKNTCQKNYWAVRTPPLYFDKMSKKKKWKKEKFPNRIYEFWLIWKKRKRVLKLEKTSNNDT